MIDREEELNEEIQEAGIVADNSGPRSRRWFITIWNLNDKRMIINSKSKYCLVSDDDHTRDGQLHWHAVLIWKDSNRRLNTENAHWLRLINLPKAVEYCKSKGPRFVEIGFIDLNPGNACEWRYFVDKCKVCTPKELIDSEYSQMYARYMKFAGTVNVMYRMKERLEELDNYWIYGPPGTGKTRYVWDNYASLYVKNMNKWWDGYNDEVNVLIDDWDPERGKVLCYYLKIWADRYPFLGETKGSSCMIRPTRILITSNYSLEDCFEGEEYAAIKRRFKVIHMDRLNEHDRQ